MALTLPPAVSRTSKADGKACGQMKCLFFGLQQMGPDGFSQTPGDACTGARGAGTEVRGGAAPCAPSSAVPTPSRTSPLTLSLGSGSSSTSKLPGKQVGNGLLSAHNRFFRFQSSFKGHREMHSCTYTPKNPPQLIQSRRSAQLPPAHVHHNRGKSSGHTFLP